jgi:hypothetical protein
MEFQSCYKCTPPKRTPGCHATCKDYAAAKAQHDAQTAKRFNAGYEVSAYIMEHTAGKHCYGCGQR